MVVKNLTNFLNDNDKYGQKVGDWALQAGDGLFKCPVKPCHSNNEGVN